MYFCQVINFLKTLNEKKMISLIISILMSAGLLSSPAALNTSNLSAAQKTELEKNNIIIIDIEGM